MIAYLRTQPFPKKKAVGQAPHLLRGLTQRFWASVAAESIVIGLSTEINDSTILLNLMP
jgi:hypothetical protein